MKDTGCSVPSAMTPCDKTTKNATSPRPSPPSDGGEGERDARQEQRPRPANYQRTSKVALGKLPGLITARVFVEEVGKEDSKFEGLDFTEELNLGIGGGAAGGGFAKVDESEGLPLTMRNQFVAERTGLAGFEEFGSTVGEAGIGRMTAGAAKPIFGIAVIGFAAVDDGVDETSVGVVDSLGNGVCGVETVVPEENQGPDEVAIGGRKRALGEKAVEGRFELVVSEDLRARAGAEFREAAGVQEFAERIQLGSDGHGGT